ncbi:MAG: hypothetical protein AAF611_20170 [Bacteroidota bacterium]
MKTQKMKALNLNKLQIAKFMQTDLIKGGTELGTKTDLQNGCTGSDDADETN